MRLFDGEWVNEWQRPPFKNAADIIAAYIDVCVRKGEVIGKGTMVDDVSRGDDPQLFSLTGLHNTVFILIKKRN
jgi:hypothetical protein